MKKRRTMLQTRNPFGRISFPKNNVYKMRFAAFLNLYSSAGPAYLSYTANSIYNIDGAAAKASAYDQLGIFYNHWLVIGSKISVRVITPSSGPCYCVGVFLNNSTPVLTGDHWQNFVQQGKGTSRVIQTAINGNVIQRPMQCKYSARKFWNVKDPQDNAAEFGAPFDSATSPTKECYYVVWAETLDHSSSMVPVEFQVIIDYIVRVADPQEMPTQQLPPGPSPASLPTISLAEAKPPQPGP